ncbi:MAG: dipeptidase PepE [Bacteroidia bacterium]|nr:dipeptidase PepE [Bacteroidia bacterium]
MKYLLLSNSSNSGESYMEWCKAKISSFVEEHTENIIFIPYAAASFSFDEYTENVNNALQDFNIAVKNIASFDNPIEAINQASAIFVGGGNTFHLVNQMQEKGLIEAIQKKVKSGTPYVGWSAGSNVFCPSICTTNDMPITQPQSFNALNLIDLQINPHYTEKTIPNHGGESRDQRLKEYLYVNPEETVLCLPEASYVEFNGTVRTYIGASDGKLLSSEGTKIISSGTEL